MQGATKVLFVFILTVANITGIPRKMCPKIQDTDWKIDIFLPHKDCDKFYQCTRGEPVEMACPKGHFYNVVDEVCEWRDLIDCRGRNVPEKKVTEVTPGRGIECIQAQNPLPPVVDLLPNGCPVDPNVPWLVPHEKACKLFYYCENGKRKLKRCPLGLYFNKTFQVCDWPWNLTCKRTTDYP